MRRDRHGSIPSGFSTGFRFTLDRRLPLLWRPKVPCAWRRPCFSRSASSLSSCSTSWAALACSACRLSFGCAARYSVQAFASTSRAVLRAGLAGLLVTVLSAEVRIVVVLGGPLAVNEVAVVGNVVRDSPDRDCLPSAFLRAEIDVGRFRHGEVDGPKGVSRIPRGGSIMFVSGPAGRRSSGRAVVFGAGAGRQPGPQEQHNTSPCL